MLIFGKEERNQIEQAKKQFSSLFLKQYDETETYHNGKWLMLELEDLFFFEDIKKLLMIKSKPNKKQLPITISRIIVSYGYRKRIA